MEEIINTKNGTFGHIRITLPMYVKEAMTLWCKRSGMRQTEFFRVALMIGINHLAEAVNAKQPNESYSLDKDKFSICERLDVRKPFAIEK